MSVRSVGFVLLVAASVAAQDKDEARPESRPAPPVQERPQHVKLAPDVDVGAGIAAAYPGDAGIRTDPRVLFVDDFESKDPLAAWTERKSESTVRLQTDDVHAGGCALSITATLGTDNGGWLFKRLPIGQDAVHVRFYTKFRAPAEYCQRFVHLTADEPPKPIPLGGAGVCPDGGRRFCAEIQPFAMAGVPAAPGGWRLASYWCEMGISSDGKYWANGFEPESPLAIERDRWTCVEFMVKSNSDPFERDGEQAFWIDGKPAGRWDGFRWRTSSKLKVNGVWLNYYVTAEAAELLGSLRAERRTTVLFDDVVVATDYVGPRIEAASEAAEAPNHTAGR